MELKDFVVSAVRDLSAAVQEANGAVSSYGGLVNPGALTSDGNGNSEYVHARTTLNFDIALSASYASTKEGGASAKIWVVEANIGGDVKTQSESVSRLTFSIDVVLPSNEEVQRKLGKVRRPAPRV